MTVKKYISNNLNAFLKLEISNYGLNVDLIAKNANIDKNLLNKLLNCNSRIKYDDRLIKIISSFQVVNPNFFKREFSFEKIRNEFYKSIFYCSSERESLYRCIIEYKNILRHTPYYIDILMIEYVYCISVIEDYNKTRSYMRCISNIILSMSNFYQKMYYVFLLSYLENTSQYQEISNVYNILSKIHCNDVNLDGRIYYVSFSIFRALGNIEKAKQYYILAKNSFLKLHNHAMLENLNIKYSILLRSVGELKEALRSDLKLLEEYTIKNYRLRNIEILYNNIAWNYSLLHDYKKAVLYYQKALESLQDNDILFNMAYCCYKIKETAQAMYYIELGKKAPNCGEYIYYLLDWLELIIKNGYSAKSFDILNTILDKYSIDIESNYRTTIQIEIINYYYYNGMYEEAINALQPLMGKQLISPSELIFAKDNGKTENDTLSFEDMDDTWNDKMIIKDDDLFFDDEKINDDDWEELDDSFSSFAFN